MKPFKKRRKEAYVPTWLIKTSVTIIASIFVVVHLVWPNLKVDAVTIALLVIAISPWFIQFLKSLELPGGIKIELKDVIEVAKELRPSVTIEASATLPPLEMKAEVEVHPNDQIGVLRSLAKTDPNLTMVGLRIEVERRLRELSRIVGYGDNPRLPALIYSLRTSGVMDPHLSSALSQLIRLGNEAAHGAQVTPDAAQWIGDLAPGLIAQLDKTILDKKKSK